MMLVPDSWGASLREFNDCNLPKGENGGQFGRNDDPRCGTTTTTTTTTTSGAKGLTAAELDQLKSWRAHAGVEMTDDQREGLRALVARTGPGGDLTHLRPPARAVIYRGDDAEKLPRGVVSFTYDKDYTSMFGDKVWSLSIWNETLALDTRGLFSGVDEGEVLVLLDGRTHRRARLTGGYDEDEE